MKIERVKQLIIIALLAVIWSCAPKTAQKPGVSQNEQAVWQKFTDMSQIAAEKPYRINFSLRVGEQGNTRRLTGLLWGEDNDIRLDIMAGVGAIVAKIKDTPDMFLLYSPTENRAYSHKGPNKPLFKIGAPLPFSLDKLAAALSGDYLAAFAGALYNSNNAPQFLSYADNLYSWQIQGEQPGAIFVNSDGFPVKWRDKSWEMTLTYKDNAPERIKLSNDDGKIAILLVKERDNIENAFSEEQMALKLPSGIEMLPLSRYAMR